MLHVTRTLIAIESAVNEKNATFSGLG